MHYRLKNRVAEHRVDTLDARVVESKSLGWAQGKHIAEVLRWAAACTFKAYVAQHKGAHETKIERMPL